VNFLLLKRLLPVLLKKPEPRRRKTATPLGRVRHGITAQGLDGFWFRVFLWVD